MSHTQLYQGDESEGSSAACQPCFIIMKFPCTLHPPLVKGDEEGEDVIVFNEWESQRTRAVDEKEPKCLVAGRLTISTLSKISFCYHV